MLACPQGSGMLPWFRMDSPAQKTQLPPPPLSQVPSVKSNILGLGTDPLNLQAQDTFIAWAGNRAFIGSKV